MQSIYEHVNLQSNYRRRKIVNKIMLTLTGLTVALAIVPLVWITVYVLLQGGKYLNLDFFIHLPAPMGMSGGGVLNAIEGSAVMVLLASVIAIPLALLGAFYLLAKPNTAFAHALRFSTDMLAGTPSIVIGLFGYAVIVAVQKHFSAFSGGVVLAIIMLPVVLRSAEEMLKLVPTEMREGALAMGAPEWLAALKVVLPAAAEGIVTGIMLGIARAVGETAPLLFTALGNDNYEIGKIISDGLRYHQSLGKIIGTIFAQPADALPLTLWKYAQQPYQERVHQAWAVAFVLMLFVLGLNIIARAWMAHRRRKLFG